MVVKFIIIYNKNRIYSFNIPIDNDIADDKAAPACDEARAQVFEHISKLEYLKA